MAKRWKGEGGEEKSGGSVTGADERIFIRLKERERERERERVTSPSPGGLIKTSG